jgi:hypothetical protein
MSEQTTPEAIMKGRFNLFQTPDGGFHIAYQKDEEYRGPDEPDIMHIDVPGFVIQGAKMMADGGMSVKDMLKMGLEARRATRTDGGI